MPRFWYALIFSVAAFGASKRALLIGINQYEGGEVSAVPAKRSPSRKGLIAGDVRHWKFQNLEGAINDVNLIEAVLLSPAYGFQPADIVKLITPEATTADGILGALRRELVDTAGKDDIRLVYYSGHGNFIRNKALKNTRNEFDQTIVPSDQWQGAVDVRDKEIGKILWDAANKGVTVTFIADSCHSGSLTRGPEETRGRARSNSGARAGALGASFTEPLIDDPVEINPEAAGVLTLAAAQENEEALELRNEKNETHGALTLALVRALREEGPHASMDRVFERTWNYLQVENLPQTPILGGKGRSDKDLLGQPARAEPFSVLVKNASGGDALLGAGEAIGLYEGSELHSPTATLVVVKSLGLSEAVAKISPEGAPVKAGDRFEVTKWGSPAEPNLRVYIPPAASPDVIARAVEWITSLRDDLSIHWVADPVAERPTAILRWNFGAWLLDTLGKSVKTTDLGGSPSAVSVKRLLPPGARLFVKMPPSAALSAAIRVGAGTRYPGIERLKDADAQRADYRLYGRLTGRGVEYAWLEADADLPVGRAKPSSSLPPETTWFDGASDTAGASLTEYAVRLGKVRAWLTIAGRPGRTSFPYHLVLRKPGSNVNIRSVPLTGGEQYKMFLQLDPRFTGRIARRWVYVFAINQDGEGSLLFPRIESGNEGNRLPRVDNGDTPMAAAEPLIPLRDIEITPPWGTDTYIVISSLDAIPNLNVFNFAGAQSRGDQALGPTGNALQDLLNACGDSSRGDLTAKEPTEWSIERLPFQSVPKK
jgi:hypothetical protein